MLLNKLRKIILRVLNTIHQFKTYKKYSANVHLKQLTAVQKNEAKKYYKDNFGVKINLKYHQLLFSMN